MESRVHAHVGLGSNVGSSRQVLEAAVRALGELPGASLTGVSRLYRTTPMGPVAQPDFVNAVAGLLVSDGLTPGRLTSDDAAMALLVALKRLERTLGRVERERWGPREIDLDLLLFGSHLVHVERSDGARSDDPTRRGVQWLDVPHVSSRERLFVLAPLADLVPDLVPPGWDVSVATARAEVAALEPPDSVVAIGDWDDDAAGWSVALVEPPGPGRRSA